MIAKAEQKDIINEAYSRANSIDAVRGFAYRSGNIIESEELDRARTMILKLIDYIRDETDKLNVKLRFVKESEEKIRSEINELTKTYPFVNHIDAYVKEDDVIKIIDKYKEEMEDKK